MPVVKRHTLFAVTNGTISISKCCHIKIEIASFFILNNVHIIVVSYRDNIVLIALNQSIACFVVPIIIMIIQPSYCSGHVGYSGAITDSVNNKAKRHIRPVFVVFLSGLFGISVEFTVFTIV